MYTNKSLCMSYYVQKVLPLDSNDDKFRSLQLNVSNNLYVCRCVCGCMPVGMHVCIFTGTLNVLLRVRSIASVDSVVWTKSGHQGPDWEKAFFDISPSGPFQVRTW